MAHNGFRVGVRVMRIGKPDALLHEITIAALAHVLTERLRRLPRNWSTR